jgi:hypothetical protein
MFAIVDAINVQINQFCDSKCCVVLHVIELQALLDVVGVIQFWHMPINSYSSL